MTYQRQPLSVTGIITNQAEGEPVITNYRRAVGEVVIGNVSDRCEWVFNIFCHNTKGTGMWTFTGTVIINIPVTCLVMSNR